MTCGNGFMTAIFRRQFDCDQLGFWLSRQPITRRHLFEGLHHPDPGRVWEFYRAAHRVYEAGDWVADTTFRSAEDRSRLRSIECGLYRTEDLLGESQYWLFPKQPDRMRSKPTGSDAVLRSK